MARKFNLLAVLARSPRGKFAEKSERAIAEVAVSRPGYSEINVISIRARAECSLEHATLRRRRFGDVVSAHFRD